MLSLSRRLLQRDTMPAFRAVNVITDADFAKGWRANFSIDDPEVNRAPVVALVLQFAQQKYATRESTGDAKQSQQQPKRKLFGQPLTVRFPGALVPKMLSVLEGNEAAVDFRTRHAEGKLVSKPEYTFQLEGRAVNPGFVTDASGRKVALPTQFSIELGAGQAVILRKVLAHALRRQHGIRNAKRKD